MAKSDVEERSQSAAIPICVVAWLIPGAGHLMQGRTIRAGLFFTAVMAMFVFGLAMEGELFSIARPPDLLTRLAAAAEIGVGLPYFVAKMLGYGVGDVTAVTYEYGYTFCIVAGLMNALIVLDAYDIALGRKS